MNLHRERTNECESSDPSSLNGGESWDGGNGRFIPKWEPAWPPHRIVTCRANGDLAAPPPLARLPHSLTEPLAAPSPRPPTACPPGCTPLHLSSSPSSYVSSSLMAVLHSTSGACSRPCWTSEVSCSRQEFFSNKRNLSATNFVAIRRSCVGSAVIKSSLDSPSTDDFQGRNSSACFDQLCAQTCPVDRDTYIQRWLEESVHEIVRNIQEAPFLQYVLDSKGRSQRQKISKELLKHPDHWSKSPLRESLARVDSDGVILVQKLDSGCPSDGSCVAQAFQWGDEEAEMGQAGEGAETSVWGVLVQARGVHANACYLLKTTRVASSAGMCTCFCLTRAKCSGSSPGHQLKNAWLV